MTPRRWLALLLSIALAIGASQAWRWSATYDEPNHLEMGRRVVEQGDWSRFDNSKMPVSAINAVPWVLLQEADPARRLFAARLPQLGWLVGCAWVVFAWTRERVGAPAALGAAALVALDPNLIAHSALVTTDAPCVFFYLLTCWLLLRALRRDRWRDHALAGAAFGLAQAAKFTSAFLLPIGALIALGWCALRRSARPLRGVPAFALAAWLALGGAYAFQGVGDRAGDVSWRSALFSPLAESELPLPLPRPWLEGMDWVKSDDDQGHGNIYADGQMTAAGQRDYYLRALAWKFPLPLLLLALAGLPRLRRDGADALAIAIPPAFLLAWFSLNFNFQLGVRYVLPVAPFLALIAARLPPRALYAGAAWTLVSGLTWWPWGLSYFNERLTDRVDAWRHLADSNLDWGHTGPLVEAWRAAHPEGLVDPQVPAPGPMLVSANALTGVLGDPARLACLREHLPPGEHLGYALYPYDLSPVDLGACFPTVDVAGGEGPLPAGEHLVVLWFRGEAALTVGGRRLEDRGGGERLLGAVVRAGGPFDVAVEHQGPEARLYIDGREVAR